MTENCATTEPFFGYEVRLDHANLSVAQRFVQRKPSIITICGRFDQLERALKLSPEYIDLDINAPPKCFKRVIASKTKLIVSYHNYERTPPLEPLIRRLKEVPADCYKIATMAHSCCDAFRVLSLSGDDTIAIPMGAVGQFGRLLAPVLGQPISYTSTAPTAPGQLSIDELARYYFSQLSPATALYGLIGDPVEQSPSHITHNRALRALGYDALYVKIRVTQDECRAALEHLRKIGFLGLSVTMPLKQRVGNGVFNTLSLERGEYLPSNTDGLGALEVIEQRVKVRGMHVVILGRGGCAQAISKEAEKRGAKVTLVSRKMIEEGSVPRGDVLVQATPVGMQESDALLIDPKQSAPSTLFLETIHTPAWTKLRIALDELGCETVGGIEMFFAQAKRQILAWM